MWDERKAERAREDGGPGLGVWGWVSVAEAFEVYAGRITRLEVAAAALRASQMWYNMVCCGLMRSYCKSLLIGPRPHSQGFWSAFQSEQFQICTLNWYTNSPLGFFPLFGPRPWVH